MVIKIPRKHDFADSLKGEVLEITGYSLPDWEISVPRKDDIIWSVILSFLISTNHRDPDDFSRRLFALTGSNKNLNSVKTAIKRFNPFRDRFSCFFNEALKQVVTEFKEKMGTEWNRARRRISSKLFVISKTLGCTVLHIWKKKDAFIYKIYCETRESKFIVILSSDYTNEENKSNIVRNFLLDHDMGIKVKFASLRYFLKKAEIPRKILKEVEHVVDEGDHFLISLLYSKYQDVISTLYNSTYLVSKLAEAGFETDPKTADSGGFSAFHHALALGKIEILYKMYYFAANNFYQTEEFYGSPESYIVNNLQNLKDIFLNDFVKFDTFFGRHPKYHEIKKEYNDLLRFNDFLLEVNSKLLRIKSQWNYYDSSEEIIFEASKRRDVILSILDTYTKFFQFNPLDSVIQSHLDDYNEFKNYCNSIDLATAVLFLSNLIFLKQSLVLENENIFSQMEISFYLTVYYNCLSDKIYHGTFEPYFPIAYFYCHNVFFIPLIRRLENMKNIAKFSRNLRDTIITKANVIKHVHKEEILSSIFKSFPIFKNVIHLNRIKNYIDTALKIKVIDEKSVLVIQRVLQVIGEYVNPNDDDDSFRRFLSLVFPKDVSHALLHIRNKLSRLESSELNLKFKCERNISLFRSMQKEMYSIYHFFNLVYNFYMFQKSLDLLKFNELEVRQVRKLKHSSGLVVFNPKGVDLEHLGCVIFRSYRDLFTDLFQIVLHSVKNKIVGEIKWTGDLERTKNHVLYVLWPLKRLVEVLAESDCIIESNASDILETISLDEENINLANDLKRKTNDIIAKCKDLLSSLENENHLRKRRSIPLTGIKNIEHFLKVLKSFTFLTDEQKDEIRKEIPEKIKLGTENAKELIKSVHENFSLNIDENAPELKIPYLSETKLKNIFNLYDSRKRSEVLVELESTNPITELEEIFSKNSVDKEKCETLCEIMQFSEETKALLRKLAVVRSKKIPVNNLRNLLNRIQLLKKILIEENGEYRNLWLGAKRPASKNHVVDKITRHYLREPSLQASVEMLFIDCMSIFESQKGIENPWTESSNSYCGINFSHILCHGNLFLNRLCELLTPYDSASELIRKMLRLIEGEDAILAILKLYKDLNGDYSLLQNTINSDNEEEYYELKKRILKCDEWKNYVLLLPRTPLYQRKREE